MVTVPVPVLITIADGETREVARTWPGGAWDCPFCSSPNDPGEEFYQRRGWDRPCANPACLAGGNGSPEAVAAYRVAEARRAAELADAGRRNRAMAAYAEASRQRREAAVDAARAEQAAAGWCWACWWRSTGGGRFDSRERKVRHRDPANCPATR